MKICKNDKTHLYENADRCPICKKISVDKWNANNKDKIKESHKKYYLKNKDKIYKYSLKWHKNNPEKSLSIRQRMRLRHKEKIKKDKALYRKKYPAISASINAKRRASKLERTPKWLTKFDLVYIKNIYIQSKELSRLEGIDYEVDHIVPLQGENVCGLHVPWNLQILPYFENCKKNNQFDGTYENESWKK